ncbi:hypothetical protein B0H13DRAFT_2543953 [Mycena leptocephala]|nr:hypothetical protein B0H13DRAFT_2543953 [Mycena leptocephala]
MRKNQILPATRSSGSAKENEGEASELRGRRGGAVSARLHSTPNAIPFKTIASARFGRAVPLAGRGEEYVYRSAPDIPPSSEHDNTRERTKEGPGRRQHTRQSPGTNTCVLRFPPPPGTQAKTAKKKQDGGVLNNSTRTTESQNNHPKKQKAGGTIPWGRQQEARACEEEAALELEVCEVGDLEYQEAEGGKGLSREVGDKSSASRTAGGRARGGAQRRRGHPAAAQTGRRAAGSPSGMVLRKMVVVDKSSRSEWRDQKSFPFLATELSSSLHVHPGVSIGGVSFNVR